MSDPNIRLECLRPAEKWAHPTGEEVREVIRMTGFSASEAANSLGLGKGGGRAVRRWIAEDTNISYANWALLCDFAGLGQIWKEN
ncbi:transcriptional regulator [Klebsiella pneumoniae]|uniref:transcriptional regulator n=1 Tax=Gammaproteobacteria TaxID=1236 RepID=UPI001C80E424|nr:MULTISPECIES: transcriptional regulator [Gammaproteobacteria]MBX4558860.1 transcriptional regulator [Klebsiella pneumoniae]MCZ2803397.1 transcriptional regulator [Vibrio alginolyticus]